MLVEIDPWQLVPGVGCQMAGLHRAILVMTVLLFSVTPIAGAASAIVANEKNTVLPLPIGDEWRLVTGSLHGTLTLYPDGTPHTGAATFRGQLPDDVDIGGAAQVIRGACEIAYEPAGLQLVFTPSDRFIAVCHLNPGRTP